ncbi:MAG: M14 family metallopeptidase [Xanthomonadales bacterium]|nr:M14 family metallopeptidase [Xanthomonadales bacterium]
MLISAIWMLAAAGSNAGWQTPAEQSDFTRTPRYEETMAWFERLDAASEQVQMGQFGLSPQGRALRTVVLASDGEFTPALAQASGKPIVLIQAAIHPGENEGKDALMALARDLTVANVHRDLLKNVVLVLVPIFNVDGHERFSPYNRINQNGPEAMGWRATAQNLNLNRDYMKADAPEMQAWLSLFNAWRPDLLIDLHNTNGADYQYELTWSYERHANLHPAVREWQNRVFAEQVKPVLQKRGWKLFNYVTMLDDTDLSAGLIDGASGPRYSIGYAAIANRAGLLVETHMLKDFKTRTAVNIDLLVEVLRGIARDPQALRQAVRKADADTVQRARQTDATLPLRLAPDESTREIEFLGYAYSRTHSDISNRMWVQYDPSKPQALRIPMRDKVEIVDQVTPPAAYVIPAQWTEVIARLRWHGVEMQAASSSVEVNASTWRFASPVWATQPFEGRLMLTQFTQTAEQGRFVLAEDSMVVSLDQPRANIAIHLLEPQAPDALLRWGFFNAIFEEKEYAEPRVMEAMARKMLAENAELKATFERRLQEDPVFAKDPQARLDFFYQRTPYFDQTYLRYPVLRLDAENLAKLQAVSAN